METTIISRRDELGEVFAKIQAQFDAAEKDADGLLLGYITFQLGVLSHHIEQRKYAVYDTEVN